MRTIEMYESDDGNLYETEKQALEADVVHHAATSIDSFLDENFPDSTKKRTEYRRVIQMWLASH